VAAVLRSAFIGTTKKPAHAPIDIIRNAASGRD
jgi:hypothetical protein